MLTPRPKRPKRGVAPKRLNAASFLAGAFALFVGLVTPVSVHLVGELPVAEIFLPLMLPVFIITRRKEMVKPTMRPLLILLAVWFAAQVTTDLYRSTAIIDQLRGDSNIIFFVMDLLCFVALLGKSQRRTVLYLVGYAVSKILMTKIHPSAQEDPWKFGYAPGCALLVLIACAYFYRRRNYTAMIFILLAFCAVNVIFNSRGMVLFIFLVITITVPIIPEQIGRLQLLPSEGTTARLFAVAALALCAGGLAFGVVEFATKAGWLGPHQQAKNEKQSQSAGGMLLGGRPEILVSSRAIMDSPILGHGSWPKDPKYTEMLADVKARYGIHSDLENDEEHKARVIPSHSSLFGAWVSAGVLGALFWIFLLSPLIKALIRTSLLRSAFSPLWSYLLILQIWNVLFSPFGGPHRLGTALSLVIMIDLLEGPMPVLVKKTISRFSGYWKGQVAWRPSVLIARAQPPILP